uniref:WASP like actin nucleation promoting factor a n=1 Tax=Neogobius melanostomus TaxID=47308 RepID=A0A8C6STF6_9GOBI
LSGETMNSHPPHRRAVNVGSILLTPQENECLFGYLGRKCASLCSAVVQVYAADRSCTWLKRCCGVACLVKDNPQRSYFIRVFDIKEGKTMYEQELYHNFLISCPRSYFITFAGDTSQIGLNFASEEEAKRFRAAINDLLNRRQRKTEKRSDPRNGPALPMATVDIKNPEINNVRFHNSHHHQPQVQHYHLNNMLSHSVLNQKDKKTKGKKKKLTKADIGTPSNFQHIGHVGWDPNTGFDLNNLDPELKNLFDMCGISEAQLKDREMSKAIYDFIEKKGGVEAVKNEFRRSPASAPPPPPPPSRPGALGTPPPPPPPQEDTNLSPTKTSRPLRGLRPTQTAPLTPHRRPASPVPATVTPAAPPPPPPPPSLGPPPPPELDGGETPHSPSPGSGGGKSALLEQIRGGTQLKKVEQVNHKPVPASTTGRDALLDQIRQGIQLKTVSDLPESSPPTSAPAAGIVGALMEVMQKRSKAIHSSDTISQDDTLYSFSYTKDGNM